MDKICNDYNWFVRFIEFQQSDHGLVAKDLHILRHISSFREVKFEVWENISNFFHLYLDFRPLTLTVLKYFPLGLFVFNRPDCRLPNGDCIMESRHRYHHLPILVGCSLTYFQFINVSR